MKRNGNATSNRNFNPQNAKPPIPMDVDEVDSAMERFIRQKYEHRQFSGAAGRPMVHQSTGSTRSSEEQPPPLPPKPSKRFGFGLRAASSTFPLSRTARMSPPESPEGNTRFAAPPSPIRVNKQSRVFGASIGGTGATFESKLGTLKDMGFPDERRNSAVLKGLSGNLERAVETLVRLGEGNAPPSRTRTPMPQKSQSFQASAATDEPPKIASPIKSNNPFDQPTAGLSTGNQPTVLPAPQYGHTNGGFVYNTQGQSGSYNPFDAPTQVTTSPQELEQSFQQLQISQPLFPHATGGYPSQQQQLQLQQARYQQSMTPPVPQMPQQYSFSTYTQHQQSTLGSYNPFLQSVQQPSSNPYVSQQQLSTSSNPYAAQSYNINNNNNMFPNNNQPFQPQAPPQQQPPPPQHQQQQQQQSFPGYTQQQYPPNAPPQLPYQPSQIHPQPLIPHPTARYDKTSILALYNYPQLAPSPLHQPPSTTTTDPTTDQPPMPKLPPGIPAPGLPHRSVTMPATLAAGSRNPFLSAGGFGASDGGGGGGVGLGARPMPLANGESRHVSQESVDVGGWQSGRHSPDAFASLSARFVR